MATRGNALAARSKIEWTASLRMPRLPVSSPTTSLPTTRATPMKTDPSATSSGRFARDLIGLTLAAKGVRLLQKRGCLEELAFGAERDQQVAGLEREVCARADVQRPVRAPQRQQLGRRRIQQPGLRDRLADRRHPRSDQQLFHSEARLAVMKRVQYIDQRRAHSELRDPVSGH